MVFQWIYHFRIILLLIGLKRILGVGILFPKLPNVAGDGKGGNTLINGMLIFKGNDYIAENQPISNINRKNSTYLSSLYNFTTRYTLSYVSNIISIITDQIMDFSNSLYDLSVKEMRKSYDDFSKLEDLIKEQFQFSTNFSFISSNLTIDKLNSTSQKHLSRDNLQILQPTRSKYDQTIDNEKKLVLKYLSLDPVDYWEYYGHEDDIIVYRLKKRVEIDHRDTTEAERWPCVKSFTVVDLPTDKLGDLLFDSEKVIEYNRYSAGREDIEIVSPSTKIVWNRSKPPLSTMKPYDFCTLMHLYRLPLISSLSRHPCIIILSTAVSHEKVPPQSQYSRSEIIFGVNILTPNKDDDSKTDLTSISHVKYAGIHPLLAWKSGSQGTIQFLKSLKIFAEKYR